MFIKRFLPIVVIYIIFILFSWCVICFLTSSYSISDEIKFPIIASIFIFVSGVFAQILVEEIKQYKKDYQLKQVFIINLKTISEGLRLQIENFSQILETLKSSTPENVMLYSFSELDYFEINKISSEQLYRIFVDYLNVGFDKENKSVTLENLRKELNFIETSKKIIFSDFEKYNSWIRNSSEKILDSISELGRFFDNEATKLLNSNANIDRDNWFLEFSDLWGETKSALQISDETYTNYEKLEKEILPKYLVFARNNMEDSRTPIVTVAFSKANAEIYRRKGTIAHMINFIQHYLNKYTKTKNLIEQTILIYKK